TMAAEMRGSRQQVLYATSAAVIAPSEWPATPILLRSISPSSGPGVTLAHSSWSMTNRTSACWFTTSPSSGPPGAAGLVSGNGGAATGGAGAGGAGAGGGDAFGAAARAAREGCGGTAGRSPRPPGVEIEADATACTWAAWAEARTAAPSPLTARATLMTAIALATDGARGPAPAREASPDKGPRGRPREGSVAAAGPDRRRRARPWVGSAPE